MRFLWVITVVALVVGCGPTKHHQDPPAVIAERTNSAGVVVEQLIQQRNYTTQSIWFTPEGSHNTSTYDIRYYVQEPGKSRREIPITEKPFPHHGTFKPVENTVLWVGMGLDSLTQHPVGHPAAFRGKQTTSHNENSLTVVVFDDKHVLANHKFLVIPKLEIGEDAVRFKDGNRTIVFLSPTGPKKYDVPNDSVEDAVDEKWPPAHLD